MLVHRAGSGPSRIAAASACAPAAGRHPASRRTDTKRGKLFLERRRLTFRTSGLRRSLNQQFKAVIAFPAHILEDRHGASLLCAFIIEVTGGASQRMRLSMYQEEKTFVLRFTLEASFPDEYDDDDDHLAWVRQWESDIKPAMLKQVFDSLRRHPAWTSHVRNRGCASTDEIEIVLERDFSKPAPFSLKP
jgi:hypothetical protein